ncbi:MAG: hypothetical protein HC866_12430 [Leptolyngbyaceae cyanobacterium RU_5_1]|nr:hypothetical protein [Leptolyngbyaceae cyanobacterium RU_5_1]
MSTGLYFGGSGLAGAIAALLFQQPGGVSPTAAFGWAIASFLITALGLNATLRFCNLKSAI